MLTFINDIATIAPLAGGFQGIWETIRDNYLQWIFIAGVAGFALYFIKDRKWMALLSFAGIAGIIGLLIFGGDALFGKGGNITEAAKGVSSQIN